MDRNTLIISHLAVLIVGFWIAGALPQAQGPTETIAGTREASAPIVAVAEHGGGVLGNVTVTIQPGSGKVLLDTNPFIQTDTQVSAKTAKNVAERITGVSLANKNVLYSFSIEGSYLGGPSAGAAMTLATIAAIRNQTVPRDTVITGTIRPDGLIGKVGGIVHKAFAAGRAGIETFYVPEGQATITTYERVVSEHEYRGFYFQDVQYVPRQISLDNVTLQRFGMHVTGVRSIRNVAAHVLG